MHPGALGYELKEFKKDYIRPIVEGRVAGANRTALSKGKVAQGKLRRLLAKWMLRREKSLIKVLEYANTDPSCNSYVIPAVDP